MSCDGEFCFQLSDIRNRGVMRDLTRVTLAKTPGVLSFMPLTMYRSTSQIVDFKVRRHFGEGQVKGNLDGTAVAPGNSCFFRCAQNFGEAQVPPKLIHPNLNQKRSASAKEGRCGAASRLSGRIPGPKGKRSIKRIPQRL